MLSVFDTAEYSSKAPVAFCMSVRCAVVACTIWLSLPGSFACSSRVLVVNQVFIQLSNPMESPPLQHPSVKKNVPQARFIKHNAPQARLIKKNAPQANLGRPIVRLFSSLDGHRDVGDVSTYVKIIRNLLGSMKTPVLNLCSDTRRCKYLRASQRVETERDLC